MEWDGDWTTPSPLRPLESWPRLRARGQRFNPRQVESQEEAPPSDPTIEPTQSSEGGIGPQEPRRVTPPRETTVEGRPPSRAPSGARVDEHRAQRPSVFSRLGHSQGAAVSRSPDRFPDLRNCPERGMLFGGLWPIPRDRLDPLPGACFNCRRKGHSRRACSAAPSVYCYNCGRRGTTLLACPRCGEAHRKYLREQGTRVEGASTAGVQQPARSGPANAPSPPQVVRPARISRWDRSEPSGSQDAPTPIPRPTPPPSPASSQRDVAPLGNHPVRPRPSLTVYFATISYMPNDLQEALLRAFLTQEQ